jgi:hypothetical protein
MHEDLLWNWWTEEVSNYLQDFYDDCVAGKRPKLAIEAPPQVTMGDRRRVLMTFLCNRPARRRGRQK